MKQNEIETTRVRQLISEHFDFALSHLKSQCTKSGESENLEPELTYGYIKLKSATQKYVLHFAGTCSYV